MALIKVDFFSRVLNRDVSFQALLPNDNIHYLYSPPGRRPNLKTLYLLHGMTGCSGDWLNHSRLLSAVEDYPLCVIMPSGENSFYSNSRTIERMFGDFICDELVKFTRDIFPLSDKREDTFIGGLSMGGFGALVNGLRRPDVFGRVTAFSSALIKKLILRADDEPGLDYFTKKQYETMFGIDKISDFAGCDADYEALAERIVLEGREKPIIYMDCGSQDETLILANTQFKDKLLSLGFDVTWDVRPGTHSWDFWNASIEKALNWLPIERLEADANNPLIIKEEKMRVAMAGKLLTD